MNGDFYSKIRAFIATAKGARRKAVTFLLQKPEEAAFMTIEGLAEASGVSAGMVSRTVREMGFVGFADMQNQIRQVVRRNISRSAMLRRASREGASFREPRFRAVGMQSRTSRCPTRRTTPPSSKRRCRHHITPRGSIIALGAPVQGSRAFASNPQETAMSRQASRPAPESRGR